MVIKIRASTCRDFDSSMELVNRLESRRRALTLCVLTIVGTNIFNHSALCCGGDSGEGGRGAVSNDAWCGVTAAGTPRGYKRGADFGAQHRGYKTFT